MTKKEIIEDLLFMQISGSVRFNRKWCWETQRYDKKLMLENVKFRHKNLDILMYEVEKFYFLMYSKKSNISKNSVCEK